MRMRAIVVILSVVATGVAVGAQSPVQNDVRNEAFLGPAIRFTSIDHRFGVMAGLRGSWPIGRSLALGGAIYTLVNKIDAPDGALPLEGALDLDLSYGGVELEYFLNPGSRTRFSLSVLLGGGATRFVKDTGSTFKSEEQSGETGFMYVVEPGGNVEWTVARWLRLNLGAAYRLVSGTRKEGLKDREWGGPSATIAFKF